MNDPAHKKSVGLLLLAALGWSFAGVLFKFVHWPPLAAGGGRGLIATLFLLAVLNRSLRFTWSPLQLGAAVAYAICTVLFAAANKMTTAANAILLQYTAPVWIALLSSWLLGEKPKRADWLTILVVFVGMGIFLYDGLQLNQVTGILLAMGSGMGFAAMIMLLRKQKDGSPVESIILGNFIGFLVGLPSMLAAPRPDFPTVTALVLLGVFQLGVPYLLYSQAIKHVTALEGALLPIIEPILNPLWVMFFFHEAPGGLALLGGGLVLGAVTWRAVDSIQQRLA